jgi:hypothetical protein
MGKTASSINKAVGPGAFGKGGFIGGLFKGQDDEVKQLDTMTPDQKQLLSSLISQINAGGYDMQNNPLFQQSAAALQPALAGFDPTRTTEAFQKQVADPALQQFEQQIAPQIQERFISAGAGRGSGAQRQLAQAGSQLQQGLSGQLAGALQQGEQQGILNQLNASGQGLNLTSTAQNSQLQALMAALGQKPFENLYKQGTPSPFASLIGPAIGAFAGGAGSAAGTSFGNKLFG